MSEKYLSEIFADKVIFRYREFSNYNEIRHEYEESDIAFFLPTQLELLPEGSFDLVQTISSLHEMRMDQIRYYFSHFDLLLKKGGYFYFKQWKEGLVLFENVKILQKDYPLPENWSCIIEREAAVQTRFFEALYKK